jgi:hypothetical protein
MSIAHNDALLHLLADLSMLTKKGEKSNMNPTWGQFFDAAVAMVGFGVGGWVIGKMTYGAIIPDNAGMLSSIGAIAAGAAVGALGGKFTGRLAQLTSILTRHSAMGVGYLAKTAASVSGFRSIFVNKKKAQDIYDIAYHLSGSSRFREYAEMNKAKRKEGEEFWIVGTLDAKGQIISRREMSDERYQKFKEKLGDGMPCVLEEIRTDAETAQTTYTSKVSGAGLAASAVYEVVHDKQGDIVSETWQLGETKFEDRDEFVQAMDAAVDAYRSGQKPAP